MMCWVKVSVRMALDGNGSTLQRSRLTVATGTAARRCWDLHVRGLDTAAGMAHQLKQNSHLDQPELSQRSSLRVFTETRIEKGSRRAVDGSGGPRWASWL